MSPHKIASWLAARIASRKFFYIVVGVFILEAAWFVFSAAYPMPFDEDFHFGLIKFYADHWSPFLSSQPAAADQFGAITRDPSYLYHYLMSFPYRTLRVITDNEVAHIIILRLMNVAMAALGLLLYAKVMAKAKASRAFVNVALGIFVLVPIVPQLAAHINYDNLLLLLLPVLCLISFEIITSFRERKINVVALLSWLTVALLMSIVKYATLPFLAAATAFLCFALLRGFRGRYGEVWPALATSVRQARRASLYVLMILTAVSAGLFVQRYGVNMMTYHTPVPSCERVLDVARCSQYSPWVRDYNYERTRSPGFTPRVNNYIVDWLRGMRYRSFFAISGVQNAFTNYRGLAVPVVAATVLATAGVVLIAAVRPRRIFGGNVPLQFLAWLTLVYIAILWSEGYEAYARTGVPVAINGRYLIPILPFAALAMGRAFSLALARRPMLKPLLATAALLLFVHGGGVMTFIVRSDRTWYWPNTTVIRVNDGARSVLSFLLYEGPR